MNRLDKTCQIYEPEILLTMGIAFDAAWDVVRKNCQNHESARRELAEIIFRFADEGESDSLRMCKLSLDEIWKSDEPITKKSTLEFSVCNGLRSLPGRNWHVQRPHALFPEIDNRRQVSSDRSV